MNKSINLSVRNKIFRVIVGICMVMFLIPSAFFTTLKAHADSDDNSVQETAIQEVNAEADQSMPEAENLNITFRAEGGTVSETSISVPKGTICFAEPPEEPGSTSGYLGFKDDNDEILYEVVANPTDDNTFVAWYIADSVIDLYGIRLTNNTLITAKFTETVEVNFQAEEDGACVFSQDTIRVAKGSEVYNSIVMPEPHTACVKFWSPEGAGSHIVYADRNPGYKFAAWYLNGQEIPGESDCLTIDQDSTITAKFDVVDEITVHIEITPDPSFGSVNRYEAGVAAGTTCLPHNIFGKKGYLHFDGYASSDDIVAAGADPLHLFEGWYFNGEKLPNEGIVVNEEITIQCNFYQLFRVGVDSDDPNHDYFGLYEDNDGRITDDFAPAIAFRCPLGQVVSIDQYNQLVLSNITESHSDVITLTPRGLDGYYIDHWTLNGQVVDPGFWYQPQDYNALEFRAVYESSPRPNAEVNIVSTDACHQNFNWQYVINDHVKDSGTELALIDELPVGTTLSVDENGFLYSQFLQDINIVEPVCADGYVFDYATINDEKLTLDNPYIITDDTPLDVEVHYKVDTNPLTPENVTAQTGDFNYIFIIALSALALALAFAIRRFRRN